MGRARGDLHIKNTSVCVKMVIGEKTAKEVRLTAHATQDSVLFDTVAK